MTEPQPLNLPALAIDTAALPQAISWRGVTALRELEAWRISAPVPATLISLRPELEAMAAWAGRALEPEPSPQARAQPLAAMLDRRPPSQQPRCLDAFLSYWEEALEGYPLDVIKAVLGAWKRPFMPVEIEEIRPALDAIISRRKFALLAARQCLDSIAKGSVEKPASERESVDFERDIAPLLNRFRLAAVNGKRVD